MAEKTTEKELNALHGTVARVLRSQLEETVSITGEDGEESEVMIAPPAVLAAAIKFLKDNDITTSIEDDENMSELEDMLKEKRKKRGLRLASSQE